MQYGRIGSRARRLAKGTAVFLVVALAAWKVLDLATSQPGVGHWKDVAARERYAAAYREVMSALPAPSRTLDVPTSFGTARVLAWDATTGGDPVVLVPGHSSGAPMWSENLPSWIGKRTVYALDPIGDAGFSVQGVPLRAPEDQAAWIGQVLDALSVQRAHVVGHSFGGATAAQVAVSLPDRVASLTLLEPVFVLKPLPASTFFWATLLMLPVPQAWQDRALAEIGGTSVEEVRRRTPMSVMINEAAKGYSASLPTPRLLSDDQWRGLDMPVRLDVGSASELAGGQAAADRLAGLLPSAKVTVWPGGTHSLPMDEHERIGRELLDFWAAA